TKDLPFQWPVDADLGEGAYAPLAWQTSARTLQHSSAIDGHAPKSAPGAGGYFDPAFTQKRLGEAERLRRERPRRRAGHQAQHEQSCNRKPEAQPEAVDVGEHSGLALNQCRDLCERARRRERGAMALEKLVQLIERLRDMSAAVLNVLPNEIGVDLLA